MNYTGKSKLTGITQEAKSIEYEIGITGQSNNLVNSLDVSVCL